MYKTKICCKDRIILSNVQGFLPKFYRLVATGCANCDKRVGGGCFFGTDSWTSQAAKPSEHGFK